MYISSINGGGPLRKRMRPFRDDDRLIVDDSTLEFVYAMFGSRTNSMSQIYIPHILAISCIYQLYSPINNDHLVLYVTTQLCIEMTTDDRKFSIKQNTLIFLYESSIKVDASNMNAIPTQDTIYDQP